MKTLTQKFTIFLGGLALIMLLDFAEGYGQTAQLEDVVYLKNGGIIRGTIIEHLSEGFLKIETRDGNVFVYSPDEVDRVAKEPARLSEADLRLVSRKNGGTAFVLSFLVPGGGQFYNGEGVKGGAMLGMCTLGFVLVLSSTTSNNSYTAHGGAESMGAVLLIGGALWSMIDAPISAARINRENGLATTYRISDDLYVDVAVLNIKSRTTPYIRAVFSL